MNEAARREISDRLRMNDRSFIATLAQTYDVPPSSYPAEAPVAGLAA